ncbi:MAG: sugar-binding protein [Phycisphaeraceae bacterium]
MRSICGIHVALLVAALLVACGGPGKTQDRQSAPAAAPAANEAAFSGSFEDADALKSWRTVGDVERVTGDAMQGAAAVRVARTVEQRSDEIEAVSPSFAVAPGTWRLTGGTRADIHSPDNSYHGRIELEWLDDAGEVLDARIVNETYHQPTWRAFKTDLQTPEGAAAARLRLTMRKTYGWYEVDDLVARHVAAPERARKIERISLVGDAEGNLFLPQQPVTFDLAVLASDELDPDQRQASYRLTDYWGAEYAMGTVALEQQASQGQTLRYGTSLDFTDEQLPVGKFFMLHVVADPAGEKVRDYRGLARLAEAASHAYAPADIPFSMRNWDARVPGWVPLAARIGLRKVATWSNIAEAGDPTSIYPARYDEILAHDMQITSGPRMLSGIERGSDWSPQTLREATAALVNLVGDNAAYMPLGNEPHGGMDEIRRNVEAYKIAYETIKEHNPDQFVVATSILDERYFEAGYHHYCDAYDFHIYESYRDMPSRINRLKQWGEENGAPKPVYCTEMGLNSQGMTRHAVAVEMIKKFTMFFAHDGAHASWFTIHYPDPTAKLRGSSTEAHNMFDAVYMEYNPKLDALTHYHFTNTLLDKDEVELRAYDDDTESFLFANDQGECLQVVWNDQQARSVFIPLPGVDRVRMVRIDGSDLQMTARNGGVTVGVGEEPLLLVYEQATPALGEIEDGRLRVTSPIEPLVRGQTQAIEVTGPDLAADRLTVQAPPRWEVDLQQVDFATVRLYVQAPADTQAREGRILVQRTAGEGAVEGELAMAVPLMGRITAELRPSVDPATGTPIVALTLANQGTEETTLAWAVDLVEQYTMASGDYQLTEGEAPEAFFPEAAFGEVTVDAGGEHVVRLPLQSIDPVALYRVAATVTDPAGGEIETARYMGGFHPVFRAPEPIRVDGRLDEQAWAAAPVMSLDRARQYFAIGRRNVTWDGPQDLSGKARVLWDDEHFYLAVEVTDDIHAGGQTANRLWDQDGLQMFIDPRRTADQKPGKYDYFTGIGQDGAQVSASYSASGGVTTGLQRDVQVAARRTDPDTGAVTYELAFPWKQLAPFEPQPHANLGYTLIINEDDGEGRGAFIGWFSGAHTKQLDLVGDLILFDQPPRLDR